MMGGTFIAVIIAQFSTIDATFNQIISFRGDIG